MNVPDALLGGPLPDVAVGVEKPEVKVDRDARGLVTSVSADADACAIVNRETTDCDSWVCCVERIGERTIRGVLCPELSL